ncbi:MAG: pseudouridine synthase, partial [Akkermansia muciniphila]
MSEEQHGSEENGGIRINKFLASCGIDSRRVADRLIGEGRVEVNGKVIDTPGMRVTEKDFVKVDGRHMTPMEEVVVLLNKPRGYVCSREAQGAIGTVYDLLPPRLRHLNYVGRLDADSEGLLIMTNKGELTQVLSHPTGGIEKEYWVTVDQNFDNSVLMQFLRGVRIPEGNARAKYVCRASARRACIVLEQGLKRQVRQMFQCLGLRVRKLVRVRIGSLWGGDLEPGSWKFLDDADVALTLKNPPRQRKYLGASQLVAGGGSKGEQAGRGVDSDEDYVFNPEDFEAGDSYEPTPEMKTRFVETEDEREVKEDGYFRGDSGFRSRDRRGDFHRREGGFQRCESGFGRDRR